MSRPEPIRRPSAILFEVALGKAALAKAALAYFGVVFGAGFVLGTLRVLWIAPRTGVRTAELLEMPVMLAVIIGGARWVAVRFRIGPPAAKPLAVGAAALLLLIAAELGMVLLRGLTIRDYFAARDTVTGPVYYVLLLVFAVMPLVFSRRGAN